MKIFDMHIHNWNNMSSTEKILNDMSKAGIYGGCILSNCPYIGDDDSSFFYNGSSFEKRMNEVMEWTKGYDGRLFPVLWIHPDEENVLENIQRAAQKGIVAFKIICNNFYVYEEKCLKLLREIASLNKPVIFHSGILWDGGACSKYNRPLDWEAVINVEGLRFSMAHCSWPWIDECIALYGKFLNSNFKKNTAEMFFDITPGTPMIYRKELLTKLYTVGYDVADNIMFGTDCNVADYDYKLAGEWVKADRKILLECGVDHEDFEKLYHKNLFRFLGIDG